jgi:hypothetical protein
MKKIVVVISLLVSTTIAFSQSVIFLHHSTGEGVYVEGGVASWIANYNSSHSKSYSITEKNFPDVPYPWQNYPYDYWYLWVNNQCSNTTANIYCLSKFVQTYDVIIFKHCFPGASILADDGNPQVSSAVQTLANYKLQYGALRTLMDTYPQKKFIVWTLAPLHRLATNTGDASRASEFVTWVKTSWLSEDGKSHPNIFIFDFFSLVAELNSTPVNGKVNCLKYDYEKSHTGDDSHPNLLANQTVGPQFAQFIVNTIESQPAAITQLGEDKMKIKIYPNPATDKVSIDFTQMPEPVLSVDVYNLQGQHFIFSSVNGDCLKEINTSLLPSGLYMVMINTLNGSFVRKFSVLHL